MGDLSDITGKLGLTLALQPGDPTETADNLDAAVQLALARKTGHAVISAVTTTTDGVTTPAGYEIKEFGPAQAVFAPPTAAVDSPTATALTINAGERLYVSSDPTAPNSRWVDVPGLDAFYRLPDVDRETARNTWADRLSKAVPAIDQATARALPIPLLRTQLAHNAKAAFPVQKKLRGEPPVDAGAVLNGITLPLLRLPLREPDCYLPVIGQAEGKLESINAWDLSAGVSLGVIQFNADRAAIFRFLWQFWTEDPDLFTAELTTALGWTMTWHDDHPDLLHGTDVLHGRGAAADKARNAIFFQTGKVDGEGRDGPYRRKLANALRNCVVWPHVQDMIVDTSAWYLQQGLKDIHAEGIGPLDITNPDRDTFVLTAMLLSGRVRYASCLCRMLVQLRQYPTTHLKLKNWQAALAATTAPCPDLAKRLKNQKKTAIEVYAQVQRLLDLAPPAPPG
jgi:hypothetical protein